MNQELGEALARAADSDAAGSQPKRPKGAVWPDTGDTDRRDSFTRWSEAEPEPDKEEC
jgi:hypothetical protein